MFFLVAIILVGVIALFMGDYWVRARSYHVTVYFENVQGLPDGAEVRLAGVKVGRVTGVRLVDNAKFPHKPAAVRLDIYRDVMLYQTDEFAVQQGALLGDKYVEVRRTEVTPKQRLGEGAEIAGGETQGSIESLAEEARGLVKEARGTLAAINGAVATEFNKNAIKTILTNVMSATGKADQLATQAMRLAAILTQEAQRTGPNVNRMAANLAKASQSVMDSAEMVRRTLATSQIPRNVEIASGNIRDATRDMAQISDNLAQVLATPDTRDKIQQALDNLHGATQNLSKVTGQVEQFLADGTVGADVKQALAQLREAADHISHISETYDQVLTDPKFTGDLQATMSAAREAAESGARAIKKAETSITKVENTLNSVGKVANAVVPQSVRMRTSLQQARDSGLSADFDVDLQYGKDPNNFWRAGLRESDRGEGINLQRSFPSGRDSRFRAGLFGGEPGVGYDLHPNQRLYLESELWDPNHLHFDLRGGYGVTPRVDVLFGLNDIGDNNEPFVGARYRGK